MQCEIPGCKNQARKVFPIEGVFSGIGLSSHLQVCGHHGHKEIQSAINTKIREGTESLINPYKEVVFKGRSNGLGKGSR
jgi:hypothetical protein